MIATALIIGAVVGGVILITVVITATVCCLRRHPWLSALRAPTASFSGLDRNGSALHERAKHRASVIAARVHESKHDARNRDDMISKGDHGAILQSSQRHSFSLNEHRGTGIEEDGFDLSSAQVTQRPRDATCIDVGHTAPQIVIDAHISPKNQTMTATLSDVLSAGGPFDRTHTSEEPHAPNPHRTLVFPNGDRNFDDSSDVLDALSDEDGANAVHRRRTTNAADLFDDDTTSASRRESDHFSFGDVQPAYARSAVLSRNPISHPPTAEDEDFRSNTHLGRSDDVNKGLGQIGQEVESVTKGHTQSTSRAAFSSPQGHARAKRATVASLLFRRSNDDDSSEASASISGPPMGAGVVPGVVPAGAGPVVNDHVGAQNTNGVEAIEGLQHAEGDQQPSGRGSPTRRTIPSIQSSIADLPKSGLQSLGDPIIRLANLDFDDASVFRGSIDAARRAKQLDFNSDMSDVKRVAGCQNLERAGSGRAHQYDESHMPESFSGSFPVLPPLFASSQGQLSSDALGGLTSTASSQIPPGLVPLEKSPPRSRIAMPKVRIVQNVGLPLQKSRGSKSSPTKTTTTTTPTTTGDTMTAEDEVLRLRLMRQQRRDSQADGAVPTNINGLVNDDDGAHGTVSDPSQFQDEHDDKDQSGSDNNFNFSGAQFLNETEGIFGGNGAPPPALVPRQGSPSSNFPSRQPSNPFGHIRRPAPFVLGAAPEQNSGAAPGGLGLGPGLLASLGSCDDNNVAGGFGFGGGFNAEGFSPTVSRGGDAPTPIKRAAGERTVVTGLISGQNSPMCGRPVHLFAPAPLSPAVQAPVLADSLARVPSQRSLYSALMVCSSSSASSANSSDSDGVGGESLLTPVAPAPRRQRRATSGHRVFTLDSSATSGNGSFF